MYVHKTHLQGPHVGLHHPQFLGEVPLLPAMSIFQSLNQSLILLLMIEKMSHIMSVCAKTTLFTSKIHRFSIRLAT